MRNFGRTLVHRAFARRRAHAPFREMILRHAVAAFNGAYVHMDRNGETRAIGILGRTHGDRPAVALDVGAHVGHYTAALLDSFHDLTVHAFEIIPTTFADLNRRFEGDRRVRLYGFGLSDQNAAVPVTVHLRDTTGSSINSLPWPGATTEMTGNVRRAREIVGALLGEVSAIDLLKVDTEGHDFTILADLAEHLDGHTIRVVQFEYGEVCIPPRVQLGDFYRLLDSSYAIGRIYPRGVLFKSYDVFTDERYHMGSFLAVGRDERTLIEALRLP